MIEVKNSELIEAFPVLLRVGATKLPARAAYRVSRLIAKVKTCAIDYEVERIELVKSMGQKDLAKNEVRVPPERMEEYGREEQALGDKVVTIDYDPVPLSLFDGVELAPTDLAFLHKFIEEGKPELKVA